MDLIKSRLSLKIENLSFISSAFSYLFPYLHHTKRTNVCLLKKKSQRRRQLVVEDGTYRWVKRAKERAWRDWPKIWTMDSSASRRPSETIRIGFDSSYPIFSAVADAAMSISRSKDDRIALADMAYFCFSQPKLLLLFKCLAREQCELTWRRKRERLGQVVVCEWTVISPIYLGC